MKTDPRTLLRVLWCEISTIAIVLTGDVSWWVSLVVLVSIPLIGLADSSSPWRLIARRISVWVTVIYLIFFPIDVFFLSERFIFAIVHLTFYLKLHTLLHQERPRERSRLHLICMFEMLAAASMTVSALFVAPLGLFVMLGTLVLTLEETRPRVVDSEVLRGAAAASAAISAPLFLLAAVTFMALPRASYGGFRLGGITGITVTGFSEQVRLGDFEEIRRDNDVVMRIIAGENAASPPRWRGPAYDRYEAGEWRQSMSGISALPRGEDGRFLVDRPSPDPKATSEVFLEPLDTDVLFLPPASMSVATSARLVFVDPYKTLRTGRSARAGRRYTVSWRHRAAETASPVGGFDRMSRRRERLYTQSPSFSVEFDALVSEIVGGRTGLDAARRVEHHLKTAYGYTLQQPERIRDDPLEDFLFEARAGHCEYFATAMVMMLRAEQIPTRLVTGFSRGQLNDVGEYEVVRKTNAHAWVEVYDEQEGWVAFDPTPPSVVAELAPLGFLTKGIDSLRMLWDMYVVAYDFERQRGLFRDVSRLSDRALAWLARGFGALRRRVVPLVAALAVGVLIWLVSRTRWAAVFALKVKLPGRRASSVVFYEKLLAWLGRLGIEKPVGQTAYQFARARESELPGFVELTLLYYRVRFGGEVLSREDSAYAERLSGAIRLAAVSDARRTA